MFVLDGAKVKRLLDEQGKTRKWFARECGIEEQSLRAALNGHMKAGRTLIKLMAIKLGIDESEIRSHPELAANIS